MIVATDTIKPNYSFICKNVDRMVSWKTTCHRWQCTKPVHRHNAAPSTYTGTLYKAIY